jgi:CO/xanthine dehydrogenase FAD-binding subunit
MKPAPFDYFAPGERTEALTLLAQYGEEAKILAGGQSLLPLMHMRLARPHVIVDINHLADLAYITQTSAGGFAVGALTRQRMVERSSTVRAQHPLLAAAMPLIGHFQIRTRGTLGGSLVHADPAAELPALCVALDASFVLHSATQERLVPAEDFFLGYLTTALAPEEMLTEIRFPAWPSTWGWDIQEVCRRAGDFALVGAIALLHIDADRTCQAVRLTLFGVGGAPVRMRQAEALLVGRRVDAQALTEVAQVVAAALEPEADIHASVAYRKEVGGVLARRTLTRALHRAQGDGMQ